jgi:Uma2 family endonuclease
VDSPDLLSYQDYLEFPDDGYRHELLDGVHVVTPSPLSAHQLASGELFAQLREAIMLPGHGTVVAAPMDVRLSDHDIVQPDLLVVLNGSEARIERRGILGPPDLLVEILSRSTRVADLTLKRDRYEACGLGEYQVIDLFHTRALRFARDGERLLPPTEHRDHLDYPAVPDCRVELAPLWKHRKLLDA